MKKATLLFFQTSILTIDPAPALRTKTLFPTLMNF